MGYSHYWNISRPFTQDEWTTITTETHKIIAAANSRGIDLAGPAGDGWPLVSSECIKFNGRESKDEAHDTFALYRDPPRAFMFCKTQRKPYDAVVVTVLWVARATVFTAIELASDGGGKVFCNMFEEEQTTIPN